MDSRPDLRNSSKPRRTHPPKSWVWEARILKSAHTKRSSAVLLALLASLLMPATGSVGAATASIILTQSGIVASDSLTTGSTSYWAFAGTASLYKYYEDSQGLHLGVRSPSSGTWVNYYAASPFGSAGLFHVTLTIPQSGG